MRQTAYRSLPPDIALGRRDFFKFQDFKGRFGYLRNTAAKLDAAFRLAARPVL